MVFTGSANEKVHWLASIWMSTPGRSVVLVEMHDGMPVLVEEVVLPVLLALLVLPAPPLPPEPSPELPQAVPASARETSVNEARVPGRRLIRAGCPCPGAAAM